MALLVQIIDPSCQRLLYAHKSSIERIEINQTGQGMADVVRFANSTKATEVYTRLFHLKGAAIARVLSTSDTDSLSDARSVSFPFTSGIPLAIQCIPVILVDDKADETF